MVRTVFPFTSKEHITIQEVGGKALELITLTRRGLRVPPGFVLSVGFFEPWIKVLEVLPEWTAIQSGGDEVLSAATRALQSQCRSLAFDPKQQEELNQALHEYALASDGELFAVRSSSPEEDLEGASFAGGYETTLGVTGKHRKRRSPYIRIQL